MVARRGSGSSCSHSHRGCSSVVAQINLVGVTLHRALPPWRQVSAKVLRQAPPPSLSSVVVVMLNVVVVVITWIELVLSINGDLFGYFTSGPQMFDCFYFDPWTFKCAETSSRINPILLMLQSGPPCIWRMVCWLFILFSLAPKYWKVQIYPWFFPQTSICAILTL